METSVLPALNALRLQQQPVGVSTRTKRKPNGEEEVQIELDPEDAKEVATRWESLQNLFPRGMMAMQKLGTDLKDAHPDMIDVEDDELEARRSQFEAAVRSTLPAQEVACPLGSSAMRNMWRLRSPMFCLCLDSPGEPVDFKDVTDGDKAVIEDMRKKTMATLRAMDTGKKKKKATKGYEERQSRRLDTALLFAKVEFYTEDGARKLVEDLNEMSVTGSVDFVKRKILGEHFTLLYNMTVRSIDDSNSEALNMLKALRTDSGAVRFEPWEENQADSLFAQIQNMLCLNPYDDVAGGLATVIAARYAGHLARIFSQQGSEYDGSALADERDAAPSFGEGSAWHSARTAMEDPSAVTSSNVAYMTAFVDAVVAASVSTADGFGCWFGASAASMCAYECLTDAFSLQQCESAIIVREKNGVAVANAQSLTDADMSGASPPDEPTSSAGVGLTDDQRQTLKDAALNGIARMGVKAKTMTASPRRSNRLDKAGSSVGLSKPPPLDDDRLLDQAGTGLNSMFELDSQQANATLNQAYALQKAEESLANQTDLVETMKSKQEQVDRKTAQASSQSTMLHQQAAFHSIETAVDALEERIECTAIQQQYTGPSGEHAALLDKLTKHLGELKRWLNKTRAAQLSYSECWDAYYAMKRIKEEAERDKATSKEKLAKTAQTVSNNIRGDSKVKKRFFEFVTGIVTDWRVWAAYIQVFSNAPDPLQQQILLVMTAASAALYSLGIIDTEPVGDYGVLAMYAVQLGTVEMTERLREAINFVKRPLQYVPFFRAGTEVPATVEPNVWESPLTWATNRAGGAAVEKIKQVVWEVMRPFMYVGAALAAYTLISPLGYLLKGVAWVIRSAYSLMTVNTASNLLKIANCLFAVSTYGSWFIMLYTNANANGLSTIAEILRVLLMPVARAAGGTLQSLMTALSPKAIGALLLLLFVLAGYLVYKLRPEEGYARYALERLCGKMSMAPAPEPGSKKTKPRKKKAPSKRKEAEEDDSDETSNSDSSVETALVALDKKRVSLPGLGEHVATRSERGMCAFTSFVVFAACSDVLQSAPFA